MKVREIAELLQQTFEGDGELQITGAATLDKATMHDLSFATAKATEQALASEAGCLIAALAFPASKVRAIIRVHDPRTAFALVVTRLYPPRAATPSIHYSAVIADTAVVDATAEIGPHVQVGAGSRIGAGSRVGAGCVIGENVRIGANCVLHPSVSVYEQVTLGDRIVLHSGCVIGADGFGFVMVGGRYQKFPQVGSTFIADDVEIGANSCVDRAALGVTFIDSGTKLDNLVHVGHNCHIGKNVVIAAQTGLSGGVVIEDGAVVGGQVGIGDKARIESKAVIGSGSGILTSKVVHAGEPVWGTPARPLRRYLQQLALLARLPQIREEVRDLARRLSRLESQRD